MQIDQEAKVSVITPMYNSADYILDTIKSVIAQTYKNWEMIIVDDCSQDNSVETVSAFIEKENRIKLIKLTQNSGGAVSRNAAIRAATGNYIAFLDSDDLWHPNKLSVQIAFMQKNNVKVSFTAYKVCDEKNEIVGEVGVPKKLNYNQLLKTNFIGCLTVIFDVAFFGKAEMPIIRKRQDYALWLTLLKKVDFAYGLKQPLATYRVHSASLSSNKWSSATYTWRVLYHFEKLGFIKCLYYFCQYSLRGVIRTRLPRLARVLRLMHSVEN